MLDLLFYIGCAVARSDARSVHLSRATVVRGNALGDGPGLLLPAGTELMVIDEAGDFSRVRVHRPNGWRRGYVRTTDLAGRGPASDGESEAGAFKFAVGLLGSLSQAQQGTRAFTTDDQVRWHTSAYASHTVWPAGYVQYGRGNFWRLVVGQRLIDFKGTATVDVGVPNSRAVEVKETLLAGRLEKGFEVWRWIYLSLGFDGAYPTSVSETLGGVNLPVADRDLAPLYGVFLGAGAEWPRRGRWSLIGEIHYAYFPSINPSISTLDLNLGGAFWF